MYVPGAVETGSVYNILTVSKADEVYDTYCAYCDNIIALLSGVCGAGCTQIDDAPSYLRFYRRELGLTKLTIDTVTD